jgi:hypothetical protein
LAAGQLRGDVVSRYLLKGLFEMYIQDFDLLFVRDTDPIDAFCQQHTDWEQRELLKELKVLLDNMRSGKWTSRDIVDLGLEWWPDGDRSAQSWLPRFIKHLEERIQNPDRISRDA